MTLHIVLPAADSDSLVWVTDDVFSLGFDNAGSLDKIAYSERRHFACSAWGNYALVLREELTRRISAESLEMSSVEDVKGFLQTFASAMIGSLAIKTTPSVRDNPGLILVTLADGHPRIYCCILGQFPVAVQVNKLTCMGDENSPARIFADYYYEMSGKSIDQVLFLGIHAMRLAHQNKAAFIGEPNAWVYRGGIFRRLTTLELAAYIAKSKSLDASIAAYADLPSKAAEGANS
jgi:hypothetical protein